jgi:hypothetical protein
MPLTNFQKDVLEAIVANRSELSHFAGGLVLNAPADSSRFSEDFDIFHDEVEDLVNSSERDVTALREAKFEVDLMDGDTSWKTPCTFRKARVRKEGHSVEVDWAQDSAFRFFPIVHDEVLGWRLHLFDMAINKALAITSRRETRDYIDIVELCRIYPLEAILWAACGKDPGYNPLSLHTMVVRFARIDPLQMDKIKARSLDSIAMKEEWTDFHDKARQELTFLADEQPDMPIGVAFVDEKGEPGWIRSNPSLKIHAPSLRGCWPSVNGGHFVP